MLYGLLQRNFSRPFAACDFEIGIYDAKATCGTVHYTAQAPGSDTRCHVTCVSLSHHFWLL